MIDTTTDEDHVPPVDPEKGHPQPDDESALLQLGGATQSQEFGRKLIDHITDEFRVHTEYRSEHAQNIRILPGEES